MRITRVKYYSFTRHILIKIYIENSEIKNQIGREGVNEWDMKRNYFQTKR